MRIGRFNPNNNGPTVTIVVPEMAINYSGVCCPRLLLCDSVGKLRRVESILRSCSPPIFELWEYVGGGPNGSDDFKVAVTVAMKPARPYIEDYLRTRGIVNHRLDLVEIKRMWAWHIAQHIKDGLSK